MNLWFFDSGNRGCGGQGSGFGCIEEDIVAWYRRRSDELEKEQGARVPAMAFFHIPPQEFMVGWMVGNGDEWDVGIQHDGTQDAGDQLPAGQYGDRRRLLGEVGLGER